MGWTQLMEVWSVLESRCAPSLYIYPWCSWGCWMMSRRQSLSVIPDLRCASPLLLSLPLSEAPHPFGEKSCRFDVCHAAEQSISSRWHEDSFKLLNLGRPGSTSRPARPRAEVGVCFINQFDQDAQKGRSWRSLLAAQLHLAPLNLFKLKSCVGRASQLLPQTLAQNLSNWASYLCVGW